MQFLDEGKVDKSDTVAILLTGSGLKDTDVVTKIFEQVAKENKAIKLPPPVIGPEISELEKIFPELKETKK